MIYFFVFKSPPEPEDACGGGCVTLDPGSLRSAGCSSHAGGTSLGGGHSLFAFKSEGEKPDYKRPARTSLWWNSEHFSPLSLAPRAGGFVAQSLDPDFLTSRLNPEEGGREGNFSDFQLCTGPRSPGTASVMESRWPLGGRSGRAQAAECQSLHVKSGQVDSVDN